MIRRPPNDTRTKPLFLYTSLFRCARSERRKNGRLNLDLALRAWFLLPRIFQDGHRGEAMRIIRDEDDVFEGLHALAAIDPRLAPVIEAAGPVPLRLMEPGFAGLAYIIVSQVVSKASAEAIWRRILAAGPATAAVYSTHGEAQVSTFGLSRAKAATLAGLADAVCRGGLDLERLAAPDPAERSEARRVGKEGARKW